MAKNKVELKSLARIGASARLKQLESERASILRLFPDMRRRPASMTLAGLPASSSLRRRPSAAARRAMSEGMRRFWARRKAAMK